MANQYKYHMIKNFTTNGDLGISTKAIDEIVTAAISEVEGVEFKESHIIIFQKPPVYCHFSPLGDLIIDIDINVKYGYNVQEVCNYVQEKVERVLLFTTEIKPKKINIKVGK